MVPIANKTVLYTYNLEEGISDVKFYYHEKNKIIIIKDAGANFGR